MPIQFTKSPWWRDGERWLLAVVVLYVLLLCVAPLSRLMLEIFNAGPEGTLALIRDMLDSRAVRRSTLNTLDAGLFATVISVVLGTSMALLVALTDVRARTLLVFLLILPLLIPAQISVLAWLQFVGPNSFFWELPFIPDPDFRGNPLYSREGVILLLGIEHAPIVFLAVRAGLRLLPGDVVEAARASGARPFQVVLSIILPLLRPAILAGAALAFVSAIGNFGVAALLGIPGRYQMLTTLIYQRLNGFGPSVLGQVALIALLLAVIAAAGLLIQAWALKRQVQPVARTAPLDRCFTLGKWRLVVEAPVALLLFLIAIAPLVALFMSSLSPAIGVSVTFANATLENYGFALNNPGTSRAFVNSLFLATTAAFITIGLAIPFGFFILNRRHPVARALDIIADAPYALPGIVLSIACILLYLRPLPFVGLSLYNSIWILLIAYLGRFMALGLRPTLSGLQQIDPQLEEAARISGAGPLTRLRTVIAPLVAPVAAAGGMLIFMAAFNELTVSALLWSAGNETLGVVIFNLTYGGDPNAAAAVSVLALFATLAVAGIAHLIARYGNLPHGLLPWQA